MLSFQCYLSTTMFRKDKNQTSKYEQLRLECLREGKLHEDNDFPANDSSLYSKNPLKVEIEWKRPGVSTCFNNNNNTSQYFSFLPFVFLLFYFLFLFFFFHSLINIFIHPFLFSFLRPFISSSVFIW